MSVQDKRSRAAVTVLSVMTVGATSAFSTILVGSRSLDVGTDTSRYAAFYHDLGKGTLETRLEPGFVVISRGLHMVGLSLTGYQAALFVLMLLAIAVAAYEYFRYLGGEKSYLSFLTVCLMTLFVSPMFVNASINMVRQGLASFVVLAGLFALRRRHWGSFVLYGAVATSLHYSSILFIACSPLVFLNTKYQRGIAILGFAAYVSGLSKVLVEALLPAAYKIVMDYEAGFDYRSGVRVDFAVFSLFWYALPYALGWIVPAPLRERLRESASVYLVLMLPFFALGWGNFSNRFLAPAWLSASLLLAAVMYYSRLYALRNPAVVGAGLVVSCGAYYYYVANVIIV